MLVEYEICCERGKNREFWEYVFLRIKKKKGVGFIFKWGVKKWINERIKLKLKIF